MVAVTKFRYEKFSELDGLELFSSEGETSYFPFHSHDYFCISLITAGTEQLETRNGLYYIPKGTVSITQANEAHRNSAATVDGYSYQTCYVNPDILTYFNAGKRVTMIQRTITDEILARSIGQIFEAEKLNLDLAKTILSRVASFVQDSNEFKTRPIRHMEALISNSGDRVLDLDWLAGEFCMSKYHFIRYFKQASGLTPQVYIMMRRLENAKQMLLKGIEIKDAAYTNGFYDPSHFTNTFKKYFGIKPSAAKKSNILQSGHL